jgi:hypothetical protein
MNTLARAALLFATFVGGCTTTYQGRVRTRDPHELPKLETYRSGAGVIGTGDVDVMTQDGHRPPLLQGAWFEVVSDSEMRFHVSLAHKWQEMADLRDYRVSLTTNRGHHVSPSDTWVNRSLVQQHEVTVGTLKPGPTQQSTPILSEETFRRDLHGSDTVVVFRHPGLIARGVRSYTLTMEHRLRRLRFTWDLVPKAELGDDE